jgi:hypothetical protein
MRVYLPKSFQREAKRDGVTDEHCREAVQRAEAGRIDAALGGGLIKQRIATGNRSAAKGARTIVFYKRAELAVFLHVFSKSDKGNLTDAELTVYRKLAHRLDGLTNKQLTELSRSERWKELEL